MNETNAITNFFSNLSKKTRNFLFVVIPYNIVLVIYDLLIYKRGTNELIKEYAYVIVSCLFIWFGIQLLFYFQYKNPLCSKRGFEILITAAIIMLGISSVVAGILYFTSGFSSMPFVSSVAFVSAVRVKQKYKK